MSNEQKKVTVEELLAKAKKPAADAMVLHPFYRGKVETALKCTVRSFDDFAIWYTPGVADPCKALKQIRNWFMNTQINGTLWLSLVMVPVF